MNRIKYSAQTENESSVPLPRVESSEQLGKTTYVYDEEGRRGAVHMYDVKVADGPRYLVRHGAPLGGEHSLPPMSTTTPLFTDGGALHDQMDSVITAGFPVTLVGVGTKVRGLSLTDSAVNQLAIMQHLAPEREDNTINLYGYSRSALIGMVAASVAARHGIDVKIIDFEQLCHAKRQSIPKDLKMLARLPASEGLLVAKHIGDIVRTSEHDLSRIASNLYSAFACRTGDAGKAALALPEDIEGYVGLNRGDGLSQTDIWEELLQPHRTGGSKTQNGSGITVEVFEGGGHNSWWDKNRQAAFRQRITASAANLIAIKKSPAEPAQPFEEPASPGRHLTLVPSYS